MRQEVEFLWKYEENIISIRSTCRDYNLHLIGMSCVVWVKPNNLEFIKIGMTWRYESDKFSLNSLTNLHRLF